MSASAHAFDPNPAEPASPPPLPLDVQFDSNHPRTAKEVAYDVLRRAIMCGALVPGTKITQSQVAKQLRISTTPVREALGRLAGDGLVRIDVHRGAIVRGLDKEELLEIYELRLMLEPLATGRAAQNITESELSEAEALWEQMQDDSDVTAWSEANRQFHSVIAQASRSPNLTQILRGLRDSATPYVRWSLVVSPNRFITANEDHRKIIDACRDGDSEHAAAVEEQHLRSTMAVILDVRND